MCKRKMNRFIKDIKKYYKYAKYSAKSELKSEIANSHLSWLWWILDPLLFMFVYAFVSSVVFSASEKYFLAFVFIGVTCWDFFNKTVKQSVKLVSSNSAIVSKVYLPKFILIFVKMGNNAFKMCISFFLVIGMMILYQVPLSLKILYAFPIMLVLLVVTFGFSTFLLHFGVFVEDLSNVINVFLRLVFYVSGVFYSITSRVSEPYQSILLKLNPIALIMQDLRLCLLYDEVPHFGVLLVWGIIGCVLSVIGVRTIYKHENSYVKVI